MPSSNMGVKVRFQEAPGGSSSITRAVAARRSWRSRDGDARGAANPAGAGGRRPARGRTGHRGHRSASTRRNGSAGCTPISRPARCASTRRTSTRHVLPLLGGRPLSSVTRADGRLLITTSREKGLKLATVKGIARTLSSLLSQAVEDEKLPANPALRMGRYLRRGDEPKP